MKGIRAEYMPASPTDGDRVDTGRLAWCNFYVDGAEQQTVCNVEISNPADPKRAARFFVSVGIDCNGKPYAQLTGLKATADTSKNVFAGWLDFNARREAAIGGGA